MNLIVFEYSSIAEGIKVCDDALKQYRLELVKQEIRCPGRYCALLTGSDANIKQLERHLETNASDKCLAVHAIYNLDDSIKTRVNKPMEPSNHEDMLVIETRRLVDAYYILDMILDRSQITSFTLLDRLGLFGKGVIMVTGKSQSIKMAKNVVEEPDVALNIFQAEIIRNPNFDKVQL